MFWTYYLIWFIGYVMGGIVVQTLHKKNKEGNDERH